MCEANISEPTYAAQDSSLEDISCGQRNSWGRGIVRPPLHVSAANRDPTPPFPGKPQGKVGVTSGIGAEYFAVSDQLTDDRCTKPSVEVPTVAFQPSKLERISSGEPPVEK